MILENEINERIELAQQGLRPADEMEAGWFVRLRDGRKVWATDKETPRLLFVQCACGSPAEWAIHGKDITDDVCAACYERYYVSDTESSSSWEATPLPTCCTFDRPCDHHRAMNADLRKAFHVAPLAEETRGCVSPLSLAFEQAERELGKRIGFPALVYHAPTKRADRYYFEPSRDGGSDIMDEDRPIRDTDIVDRLNEQDDDLARRRGQIADLRAQLDDAHQHIDALVFGIEVFHPFTAHNGKRVDNALTFALDAARAWLRQ